MRIATAAGAALFVLSLHAQSPTASLPVTEARDGYHLLDWLRSSNLANYYEWWYLAKMPFDPAEGVGAFLAARGQHHGIILRAIGNVIAFCPPLIIQESEIDLMFHRFALTLEDTLAMVRERKLVARDSATA